MRLRIMLLVVCLLVGAVSATAGPPALSIEIPAKAFDEASRGAVLLVRVAFHDSAVPDSISGFADGIVNGKRRKMPLRLIPTSQENVYAVKQQWPGEGIWVLTITAQEHVAISALVRLGANGGAKGATVRNLKRKASAEDVEEALRAN